jgi:exosome complex component RRP42
MTILGSRLSNGEKDFIIKGVSQNVRSDGRSRLEYRSVSIECGVITQANGSSRVTLIGGETDVLAAVRVEICEVDSDYGNVECNVEVWASARASISNSGSSAGSLAQLNTELTAAVSRLISAKGAIDLRKLCIVPRKLAWKVFVDLIVIEAGGSLLDTCVIAAHAALKDTRLPKLRLIKGAEEGVTEIEMDDDAYAFDPFPSDGVPIALTFTQLSGFSIVDADSAEDLCASTRSIFAVTRGGNICSIESSGPVGISPEVLHKTAEAARVLAKSFFERVDKALERKHSPNKGRG